ncbi:Fanconi anemia group M protein-like, partial [Sphaerodactylus townsendi]|uniref:Fanconi anemia group M protein-like n=1 Tax=Sphaerodactylus townsendi TaxID=933632 RepID=UPI0020271801
MSSCLKSLDFKKQQHIFGGYRKGKTEAIHLQSPQVKETGRGCRGTLQILEGTGRPEARAESQPADTRVMIFSSFRDSVCEIAEMLNRLHPIVRVMTFVGHSTGKNAKGFTQKEQLEVVKLFRAGGYNTLVSTCVGEEGLDIGEVDLIICFDAQKSPVRLVQRMGRTGRKRKGRIVVILSEGREERTYNQSQSNKRSILKAISESKGLHFYQHSPRMIPEGVNPTMHRILVTPPEREPSPSPPGPTEGRAVALQRKWLPGYAGT